MPAGVIPAEYYGIGDINAMVRAVGKVVAPKTFNALELQENVRANPTLGITLASMAATEEGAKGVAKAYGIDTKHLPSIIGASPIDPVLAATQIAAKTPGTLQSMSDVLRTGVATEAAKGQVGLQQAQAEAAGGLGTLAGEAGVAEATARRSLMGDYANFVLNLNDPTMKQNLMFELAAPKQLELGLEASRRAGEAWLAQFEQSREDARALLTATGKGGLDAKDIFGIMDTIRGNQKDRIEQLRKETKREGESDEDFISRLQGLADQYNTDSLAGAALAQQLGIPTTAFTRLEVRQKTSKTQHEMAKLGGFVVGGPVGAFITSKIWEKTDPEWIEVSGGVPPAPVAPLKPFNEALSTITEQAGAGNLTLDEIKSDPSGWWGTLSSAQKKKVEAVYAK